MAKLTPEEIKMNKKKMLKTMVKLFIWSVVLPVVISLIIVVVFKVPTELFAILLFGIAFLGDIIGYIYLDRKEKNQKND